MAQPNQPAATYTFPCRLFLKCIIFSNFIVVIEWKKRAINLAISGRFKDITVEKITN